jgi:hypothetical protein
MSRNGLFPTTTVELNLNMIVSLLHGSMPSCYFADQIWDDCVHENLVQGTKTRTCQNASHEFWLVCRGCKTLNDKMLGHDVVRQLMDTLSKLQTCVVLTTFFMFVCALHLSQMSILLYIQWQHILSYVLIMLMFTSCSYTIDVSISFPHFIC